MCAIIDGTDSTKSDYYFTNENTTATNSTSVIIITSSSTEKKTITRAERTAFLRSKSDKSYKGRKRRNT